MIRDAGPAWPLLSTFLLVLVLGLCSASAYLPPEELQELVQRTPEPSSIEDLCVAGCAKIEQQQVEADDAGTEVGCGVGCRVDHCTDGCLIWKQALNSSCRDVCNATQRLLYFKELYCTIGCQNAMNQYFQQIRANIGVPPTPTVVEDSLTATSLSLKWDDGNLKKYGGKILYFAQCNYDGSDGNWQYCEHQSWNENNQIFVHNLQPYTRYQFRLAILLTSMQQDDRPVFSQASQSVLTFARGPPGSAPVILKAMAIDHSRIYVNWKPGLFTNGPLFSYVLRLEQKGHEAFQLKDIPISQDTFMFQNLDPNTNYTVTLTMRNADGEGPGTSVFVTTLFEPEANSSEKPSLIITSDKSVARQSADALAKTTPLVETAEQIRDSAIHLADSRLYLCDSADRLYLVSLDRTNASGHVDLLLDPNNTDYRPWSLALDWLNSRLYIAGSNDTTDFWEIGSMGLDGGPVIELLTEITSQPSQLEVDPYNGYLFWMTTEGIYRVELSRLGRKPEPEPQLILKKQHLGAFMVDSANRRLLVAYQSENTVKSVSLDGKVVVDVRVNTKQPKFKNVTSISMANGLFYWTNGVEILAESYDSSSSRFVHSILLNRLVENFVKVHVLAEERQPVPMPMRPPQAVQALALADQAKISWKKPEMLPGQSSNGAWANWSYALLVEDDVNGELIQERGLRTFEHLVKELKPGAIYSVKVDAYSASGDGPWSDDFKIRTLKKETEASITWTTNETLLQSDLIGNNVKVLINVKDLVAENKISIIDHCWCDDVIFVVGNNSRLYRYNATSQEKSPVKYVSSASRVAYEWISRKIYWSDDEKRIVTRSNLDGSHQEPIAITGLVQKLLIDSLEGHLYWSTKRTVEVVRLNGENRRHYHSEYDFDGRHVAGLTLDLDNRFVYWILGDYEGAFKLYRAFTADMLLSDQDILPEMVSTIKNTVGHSLSYISNRLLLLDSPRSALVTDAQGTYKSILGNITTDASLTSLSIKRSTISPVNNSTKLDVRPEAVNASSISIVGSWRDFNVTWQPVPSPNYGQVFYEVSFADYINVNTQPLTTSRTSLGYANADRLLPYSLLEVSIRSYTYWEAAARVSRVLRSPQSVPSQPADPRVFVESFKDPLAEYVDYFATFRWNTPEFVNGPILGYTIQCWLIVDGAEVLLCDSINVTALEQEYKVHNLQSNTTYYFQVRAYSEVGTGPFTDTVSASTDSENPVPQLLVATIEDVKKVDLDERSNITITRHIAVEVAHLAAESKIYWINEMQELVTADIDGKNITKILTLNNTALSLCADWISRSLFWTESSYEDSGISHIMKLDITVWESGEYEFSRILSRNRRIVNLDIAPLTGNLFWMELSTSDLGFVMQSDLSGENVQPFFNHTEDCSCPFKPMIQPVFTIDNTDPLNPVIYWISPEGQLYIADIEGCICSLVVDIGPDRGLPPMSLTTDKSNIYWSSMENGKIYYTNKNAFSDDIIIKDYPINDARSIRAIGKSLQPYPDSDCLIPQRAVYSVQQVSKSASSITVRLPEPKAYLGCEKYILPATKYTIDVAECRKIGNNRSYDSTCVNDNGVKYQTYKKTFEVGNLKPFTEYRFKLSLANFYSDQDYTDVDQYGPGLVLKTDVGVPSKPENVEVRPLTPILASISWTPPREWNADFVRYKVYWKSVRTLDETESHGGDKMVKDGDVTTELNNLTPGHEYRVFVRAYPEDYTNMYNESEEISLKMYPEPNNLTLSGVSSEALNVSWTPMNDLLVNYTLQFAKVDDGEWQNVPAFVAARNQLVFSVRNLKSKEFYRFRLILKYRNSTTNFVWPNDDRFTYQTLEDIPTAPGVPKLEKLQDSNYQLQWTASKSHNMKNLVYILEGATISPYDNTKVNHSSSDKWIRLYNGSENYWDVQSDMQQKYVFRVRAKNEHGFGNWSEISSVVDLSDMTRAMVIAQEHLGLILGLSIPTIAIVLLCFCYFICPYQKKSKEEQKKAPIKVKPNVELATLREIPRGNFIESNSLYVAAVETDSNNSLLPKIQREQISLAKFLGKGAFGEVFQGVARDIESPGSRTPIAVKTLRKGATSQEKNEFLQEAKLMSQFKHKHVLRLLGVCLDTDPPLMLLELMAGGDLLSYLRNSRSLKPSDPEALRLQDLLSMCEDVARGCRYLEELHFVHRDLACRNCLVSARERELRVVKIGDFGLARDIYKNDYYRKEGEGLLPVRWMAPESLVDGVFTSQSDVWAFGVLMWEITSLGQQPYQARTNLEVLHHVRAGGRLPKPLNCPARLHQLMLKCWGAVDLRPSFKDCLDYIVVLRNSTEDATLSPVNQFHVTGNAYKSSHFKDNLSIQTLLRDSDSPKPSIRPKYSWLLDDTEEDDLKDPRAAYEIPKSIPVAVGTATPTAESRYIEVCSGEAEPNGEPTKNGENNEPSTEGADEGLKWERSCLDGLNLSDRRLDRAIRPLDKRSSSASLGDRFKTIDGLRQSGSYAKLVGNGESVTSLSDWRRVKRIAGEDKNETNSPPIVSYSTLNFGQKVLEGTETTRSGPPRLQRSKSSLQTGRANIPLAINSALLNRLRQESEMEDEEDEVSYANIHGDNVDVTDL